MSAERTAMDAGQTKAVSTHGLDEHIVARLRVYSADELAALLPMPSADAHKYSRGKLSLIAGSAAYPGAACLAAFASQRVGAGYTELYCAAESLPIIQASRPSLVTRSWEKLSANSFAATRPERPVAYAIGSGFDTSSKSAVAETKGLVHLALKHAEAALLVDGSALAVLSSEKSRRLLRRRFVRGLPTLLTPHAGEAARLAVAFDLPTDDPARLSCLLSLAYGALVVLKGSDTYISDGDNITRIQEGTPALAKAGTGDVLAGIISGLLAQGLAPFDAAVLGVVLHARAGRAAARRLSDISVTAEDVIEAIPAAILDIADSASSKQGASNARTSLAKMLRIAKAH